jgi:hypothetical protein
MMHAHRPLIRLLAVTATAMAVTGSLVVPAVAVADETRGGSAVTVKWAGGNEGDLQQFQPDHAGLLSDGHGNDAGSGHWNDFKNLSVTVSKTKNMGDEAVTVTASGMAPTRLGTNVLASNYLQIMQCWGPDPLAEDFAETCQFGSWNSSDGDIKAGEAQGGILGQLTTDRLNLVRQLEVPAANLTTDSSWYVPFRAATGGVNQPLRLGGQLRLGVASYFNVSNSNEAPFVQVAGDGTSRVGFEVQSAITQPYLGCGEASTTGGRCWLVVVPRGTHSGELAPGPQRCWPDAPSWGGHRAFGSATEWQIGSPISPDCSYWRDRVVVPLDFVDISSGCRAGGAEVRMVGSEFLAGAMSSWQKGLCADGRPAYSLTSNAPDLARAQLLQGQVPLAVTARPVRPDTIGAAPPDLLGAAQVAYAPVANTGLVIAYVAANMTNDYRNLRITPRLLAKVLTQSYSFDIPIDEGRSDKYLVPTYRPTLAESLMYDPEWAALGNPQFFAQGYSGAASPFVIVGPAGDDMIRLLWQYIQSDADAAAFLRGEPDPWGKVVNPSYLVKGAPGVFGEGLPVDLSQQPIDTTPKADPTVVGADRFAVSSLSRMPYSATFAENAVRIFRADPRLTDLSDDQVVVAPGVTGAIVKRAPMTLGTGGRITLGPVDAARTARYQLGAVQLALPIATRTERADLVSARSFVAPTDATMSAAMAAMAVDADTGTATMDFSRLTSDAYPLTATLYGAVDLASSNLDAATRENLAGFLDYVRGPGNTRGEAPGELPSGYLPLTADQIAQTAQVADALRHPPAQVPETTTSNGGESASQPPAAAVTSDSAAGSTSPQTTVTTSSSAASSVTDAAGGPGQAALGGTLVAGVAGLAAAPFLLRRRPSV